MKWLNIQEISLFLNYASSRWRTLHTGRHTYTWKLKRSKGSEQLPKNPSNSSYRFARNLCIVLEATIKAISRRHSPIHPPFHARFRLPIFRSPRTYSPCTILPKAANQKHCRKQGNNQSGHLEAVCDWSVQSTNAAHYKAPPFVHVSLSMEGTAFR